MSDRRRGRWKMNEDYFPGSRSLVSVGWCVFPIFLLFVPRKNKTMYTPNLAAQARVRQKRRDLWCGHEGRRLII